MGEALVLKGVAPLGMEAMVIGPVGAFRGLQRSRSRVERFRGAAGHYGESIPSISAGFGFLRRYAAKR